MKAFDAPRDLREPGFSVAVIAPLINGATQPTRKLDHNAANVQSKRTANTLSDPDIGHLQKRIQYVGTVGKFCEAIPVMRVREKWAPLELSHRRIGVARACSDNRGKACDYRKPL